MGFPLPQLGNSSDIPSRPGFGNKKNIPGLGIFPLRLLGSRIVGTRLRDFRWNPSLETTG